MDEETRADLEYAFSRRWGGSVEGIGPTIPERLYAALSTRLGDFAVELAHPIGSPDEVDFLLLGTDGEAIRVRFEPPSTTTLTFLGSLGGGAYRARL